MPENWRQKYQELTDFITENPEIKIGASVVRISENVRPKFYQLFEEVRKILVKEKYPALLDRAQVLSQNYMAVEEEVIGLIGLEGVSALPPLQRFLHDPIDQLIRELFNPLFDLIKGVIDVERYEEEAAQSIESSFNSLYQSGYEKWMTLSLVKLLEADRSFQVSAGYITEDAAFKHGGLIEEPVPVPEESKYISFKHTQETGFIAPDIIVHSARVDRYFAFRSEIGKALALATNASEKREWLPRDSVEDLEPSVTLVYRDKNYAELALIADGKKICRPDLIIECIGLKEIYNKDKLARVRLYQDSLKPRLGSYIVSNEPAPELEPEKQDEDIHVLTVAFDQSKLEQVASLFIEKPVGEQIERAGD